MSKHTFNLQLISEDTGEIIGDWRIGCQYDAKKDPDTTNFDMYVVEDELALVSNLTEIGKEIAKDIAGFNHWDAKPLYE